MGVMCSDRCSARCFVSKTAGCRRCQRANGTAARLVAATSIITGSCGVALSTAQVEVASRIWSHCRLALARLHAGCREEEL